MRITRTLAVFTAGLVGMAGLGTGVAVAQSPTAAPPSTVTVPAPGIRRAPVGLPEVVEELHQSSLPADGYADQPARPVDQQNATAA